MRLENRIKHLEKKLELPELNFSELTDDELLAIIGDDYKWLSKLTDLELEEMIVNEQ